MEKNFPHVESSPKCCHFGATSHLKKSQSSLKSSPIGKKITQTGRPEICVKTPKMSMPKLYFKVLNVYIK
jgi:hypothetical protein